MNNALYYPSIEFQDYEWLWSASLVWDRIYRIIPDGYEPDDPENVQILTEAGEIGIPLRPGPYAKETSDEFLDKIKSGDWDAAALEFDMDEAYARLHEEKVDVQLRQMLVAAGKADARDEWLHVPRQFESLYMTFLAEQISRRNGLHLLTDFDSAWSASTYFKYDGQIIEQPWPESTYQLAVLVIRDFVPQNILQFTPNQILKFREKYKDERQQFITAIQRAAENLAKCEDQAVYEDALSDLKRTIEAELNDYKKSLSDLKVLGWTGLKSVSFPVATKVAAAIAGQSLDPYVLTILSAMGIGLGLVSGFKDFQGKQKRLREDCDYSYLFHLRRDWRGCARYDRDFNYLLSRRMQDFIDD